MERPTEKAKAPEQLKAIRALRVAVCADRKRLFLQVWAEVAVA